MCQAQDPGPDDGYVRTSFDQFAPDQFDRRNSAYDAKPTTWLGARALSLIQVIEGTRKAQALNG